MYECKGISFSSCREACRYARRSVQKHKHGCVMLVKDGAGYVVFVAVRGVTRG